MVKSPELEQTILAATSRTLPRDRYPVFPASAKFVPVSYRNRHPPRQKFIYTRSVTGRIKLHPAIESSPHQRRESPRDVHIERVGKLLKAAKRKALTLRVVQLKPAPEAETTPHLTNSGYRPGSQHLHLGGASRWVVVGRTAHCP